MCEVWGASRIAMSWGGRVKHREEDEDEEKLDCYSGEARNPVLCIGHSQTSVIGMMDIDGR